VKIPARWWRGERGEWYFLAQIAVMIVVFFGPRHLPGTVPPFSGVRVVSFIGGGLMAAGAWLLGLSLLALGVNLSPLPRPTADVSLVESGPYRFARHPMYSGLLLIAFGWALVVRGRLTLVWVAVLFLVLDFKSRREERWLGQRLPRYADYRRRVRRFIPFVY
jgi:protein-S-isoprenylcysteine O-methyltransferase Ste14